MNATERLSQLAAIAAEQIGASQADIIAPTRGKAAIADGRIVFYRAARELGYSASEIARFVGRDHSTVVQLTKQVRPHLAAAEQSVLDRAREADLQADTWMHNPAQIARAAARRAALAAGEALADKIAIVAAQHPEKVLAALAAIADNQD